MKKLSNHEFIKHETKRKVLYKFLMVLFLFVLYFLFIANRYGIEAGFLVSILSWSFFVLCTPVADAGFLIDFPMRLVTNIRMIFSELFVWGLAILFNLFVYFFNPAVYQKTELLKLFYHILQNPIPFWTIIILSALGTFVSIYFGDELLDNVYHKDCNVYKRHNKKYKILVMFFIFGMAFIVYDFLLDQLGVNIFV